MIFRVRAYIFGLNWISLRLCMVQTHLLAYIDAGLVKVDGRAGLFGSGV